MNYTMAWFHRQGLDR